MLPLAKLIRRPDRASGADQAVTAPQAQTEPGRRAGLVSIPFAVFPFGNQQPVDASQPER